MMRFLAGVISALLLTGAGLFMWKSVAEKREGVISSAPSSAPSDAQPLAEPPTADRDREQKRFDRYDKDRDESITRAEYLAPRQKAFAKLDINHDGKLDFEEWSAKTIGKFTKADADHSGTLNRAEFSTTKMQRRSQPRCACRPDEPLAAE